MPRKRQPLISVRLRENAGVATSPYRVDRTQGIIFGVKVIGRDSPNCHGLVGVDGTIYTPEAMEKALPLYEGLKVNVDHPPREKPGNDRSSYDRLGKLVNCRIQDGEMYADLHLLTKHPLADRLMEAAEKMPDMFGLSHNAGGKGEVEGGKFVVREIPYVRSVDVVADPGSVHSLFESKETKPRKRAMKKRTLFEALKKDLGFKAKDLKILEAMGMSSKCMEDEEPGIAEEPTADDHLANAVMAIFQDSGLDVAAKKKKLNALLKVSDDTPETDTEEADEEPAEDGEKKKAPVEEAADWDSMGDKEKAAAIIHMRKAGKLDSDLQSREDQAARLRFLERKDAVRDLCESEQFTPSKLQLKALLSFENDKEVKAFIQEAKAAKVPAKGKSGPRTGLHFTQVRESRSELPRDAKEFATSLLS